MVVNKDDGQPVPTFPVVGIGASAGGINALKSLFSMLPAQTGLAFVVVQHLLAEQPSYLAELIGKTCLLPVCEAEDGMLLEPDHVYIIAPGELLTLEGGVLRCCLFASHTPSGIDLIDTFFESLAKAWGAQARAVILSGTGTDGAAGAMLIKQAGGQVIVQDPMTAAFDGMPSAAIATGMVDQVLPVESIAQALLTLPAAVDTVSDSGESADVAKALDEILTLIRRRSGSDWSGYKVSPLLWRIQQRKDSRKVKHLHDYAALLHDDPAELEKLIQSIPIHVTAFFRDPEAWDVLTQEALIPLIQAHTGQRPLRIWTPACATGEEAYSLAMLLIEQIELEEKPVDFQIFATDASSEIIARASDGVFSAAAVQGLSAARRERFFYAVDGNYRVHKSLREKLVFAPQHLLADPAFMDLDLVTCRNMLIYLKPAAIDQVLAQLHASLRMGGYLFLGRGESLSPKQRGFEVISFPGHLYQKIGPLTGGDIPLPKHLERLPAAISSTALAAETAHRAVLEKFALPSVLIDDQFNVLRVFGDTDAFLHLPPGQPTLNLLELVQPSLRDELQRVAAQAVAEGQSVNVAGLYDTTAGDSALSLRLTPTQQGEDGQALRLLVSFVRTPPPGDRGVAEDASTASTADPTTEQPSENWQNTLRLTIHELEASREELRVLNEELRTVNNQLNLSNEEVNQVNAQLRANIQELATQNQVLSSGAVITLFLDQALHIRWFTPAISALFPLQPYDTGRQITELMPKFEDPHFIDDIQAVMQTGEPREREVRNYEGRHFSRRIFPFRADEAAVTGVAITFNDITELKHYEERVLRRNKVLKGIARIFREALTCQNEEELGHVCLEVACDVTQSRFGFIGEVNPLTHRLETLAISEPGGDAGRMPAGSEHGENSLPIHFEIQGIYEQIRRDGQSLIINNPSSPPERIGTPPDPPPLQAFLGVPLIQIGQTWGMIGLGNRAGGYETDHREAVESLAPVILLAFLRKRAEDALSAELAAMQHLHTLSSVALTEINFQQLLEAALDATMALHQADFGTVQMYDPQTKTLQIEAQRGFASGFTAHLADMDAQEATFSGVALASDQRILVEDTEQAPADEPWVEAARRAGYRALQSTPLLMPDGQPIGMLSTHFRYPRQFTEAELTLTDLFTREIARIIAHARAETALRESEHKYRELFNLIDEGFCIIEVLFDAHNQPVDYRFLEVNAAFEQQTGLIDVEGKTMRALRPDHEAHWFEIYGRVALTGEPIRFEKPDLALGRLYATYAFQLGHPNEHKVAILFRDITEKDPPPPPP